MPTSEVKKVLAEFAWNTISPPEAEIKKVLAEFAWNTISPPEAEIKKVLAEFAWSNYTPPPSGYLQATPIAEISNDYTINAISGSSAQYTRTVEQVPVVLSVRGPATLRGRATAPTVTIGKKK